MLLSLKKKKKVIQSRLQHVVFEIAKIYFKSIVPFWFLIGIQYTLLLKSTSHKLLYYFLIKSIRFIFYSYKYLFLLI